MFDFIKIAGIIPENGTLSMMFSRKGDDIIVVYAPKMKESSDNNGFAPLTVRGTPEELNKDFPLAVQDIAAEQQKLTELLRVKVNAAKKKAEITKAADKKRAEIAKASGDKALPEDKKALEPAGKPKPPLGDLFTVTPKPIAQTKEVKEIVATIEPCCTDVKFEELDEVMGGEL